MRKFGFMTLAAATALLAGCDGGGTANAERGAAETAAAPAAATTAQRDWTQVMAATPEGGFRIGNPDAPVKLVEYASFTCPHCADFHEAAMETLRREYIAPGRVSYELRSFVMNGPDLAASLLARCQGAAPFFRMAEGLFENQEGWFQAFTQLTPADQARLTSVPGRRQPLALADAGNLDDFVRLRGIPRARYEACLTDQAAVDQLSRIRNEAIERYEIPGTPTFLINGEVQQRVSTWQELQPLLRTAG